MRLWTKRTVPHTRRKLTDEEKETIGFAEDDEDDENYGGDYNPDNDYESDPEDYVVNGSLPIEQGGNHTMSWGDFERFVRNIRGYFNSKEIDGIKKAIITVAGMELEVSVYRKYWVYEEDCREVLDINIITDGIHFYQTAVNMGYEIQDTQFGHFQPEPFGEDNSQRFAPDIGEILENVILYMISRQTVAINMIYTALNKNIYLKIFWFKFNFKEI